jgi:hypothetical protein
MGPLTLTALNNLTTAIDNLSANLPTNPDDAADAALIDAQTARVVALTPAVTPVAATGTVVTPAVVADTPVVASAKFSG